MENAPNRLIGGIFYLFIMSWSTLRSQSKVPVAFASSFAPVVNV